jgi:hypothetical protein
MTRNDFYFPPARLACLLMMGWLLGSALTLSAAPQTAALADQEIRPPFGFQWGENPERLRKLLEQAKAKVEAEDLVNGRVRLQVSGISQRMLLRSFFYFDHGSLSEIELHYGHEGWDSQAYTDFFDKTRRFLDQKYGQGRLLARTKNEQGGVKSSLLGYQWNQPGASLQIFLFIAERGAETKRILSLHYRG